MSRFKNFLRSVPLFLRMFIGLYAVCLVLFGIACYSVTAADALNTGVCTATRRLLSFLTRGIPFSLGEMLLLALIPAAILLVLGLTVWCKTKTGRIRLFSVALSVALFIASLHVLTIGIAYHVPTLAERLSLPAEKTSVSSLFRTAKWLKEETESLAEEVSFDEKGAAVMPYSLDEMSEKLMTAYDTVCAAYPFFENFSSRIKPVTFSRAMSYTYMVGIYSFYTGESNLNIDYSDYNYPFTAAHEFAHQRGIIREDEANFLAFLVCAASDDVFIRYSGYLNLYEYVANALAEADYGVYCVLMAEVSPAVVGEWHVAAEHSEQYSDSKVGEISQKANDSYLKANGVEEGADSYDFVVDLAVSYFLNRVYQPQE